jgi:hypothetical protein
MPVAKLTSLLAALCAAGAIGMGTSLAPALAQSGAPAGTATVAPTQPTFRATDRIGVTADARNLSRSGSNFRIYTVPVGTPDVIADVNEFARNSESIRAALHRMTLPPGLPGRNEIRLMQIPQFETRYTVAARAPVEVGPRTKGTTLAYDLTREAKELGPVRFEAKYRDQPFVLEGAFLRVETRTTGLDWARIIRGTYKGPRDYMATYVGHLGTEHRRGEGPAEVLCLMDAEDTANVRRMATLNPGDPVLLRGHATSWGQVYEREAVIFDRCVFAK